MKKKLPIFAILSVLAAATAHGQTPSLPATAAPDAAAAGQSTLRLQPSRRGQRLIQQSVQAVDRQRSISAQMRHSIRMFGHQLVGTGTYQQLGTPRQRMLRLDMKVKVADQMTSMQQICDGRFLWIRRDFAGSSNLGRVDLRRIREAVDSQYAAAGMSITNDWMITGGLPQLVARLDENFDFSAPREAKLDDVDVWVTHGSWKAEKLAQLLPKHREQIASGEPLDPQLVPEQLPTQVRVVVQRSDAFPRRIEYLRPGPAQAEGPPPMVPMMAIELFDVRLSIPIDPLTFVYKPGNQEVADHTDLYLRGLDLPQAKEASKPERSSQR